MILLIGFYADADPGRRSEFLKCVRHNTANAHIDDIVVFVEDEFIRYSHRLVSSRTYFEKQS